MRSASARIPSMINHIRRLEFATIGVVNKERTAATADTEEQAKPAKTDIPRGVIAEWTVTILLLLFGTATLVQAYVIPTGSMEDTLLIGDHLLVDKLAYAPSGPIRKHI